MTSRRGRPSCKRQVVPAPSHIDPNSRRLSANVIGLPQRSGLTYIHVIIAPLVAIAQEDRDGKGSSEKQQGEKEAKGRVEQEKEGRSHAFVVFNRTIPNQAWPGLCQKELGAAATPRRRLRRG